MIANPEYDYPIPYNHLWNIVDPSKVEDWVTCHRKFFFNHVLGWKSAAPNNHLIFGEAMHKAIEHLLLEGIKGGRGYELPVINEAYESFLASYRQELSEGSDDLYWPKTPPRMMAALIKYAAEYDHIDRKLTVLHTEVSGSVPIGIDRSIYFRIDAIVRDEKGEYFTLEHKSGSGINRMWQDKWALHHQPFTYSHVLFSIYPPKLVKGVKINGIHFPKIKKEPRIDLVRIPCWKSLDNMKTWLWEINNIFDELEFDFFRLAGCKESDHTLMAFGKNPESCTKFFGCPFHDYCCAWSNPLRYVDDIPFGFEVQHWDPREMESRERWEVESDLAIQTATDRARSARHNLLGEPDTTTTEGKENEE